MPTAYQPTLHSVDAVTLKSQIESNLASLKAIQEQSGDQLSNWNNVLLSEVIAFHEQQLAQLIEDLLINKII